jgi:hypothetical protein
MATGVDVLGQLPSRGDFPRRRNLPAEPARPLDGWVAAAVVAARREALGAGGLAAFLEDRLDLAGMEAAPAIAPVADPMPWRLPLAEDAGRRLAAAALLGRSWSGKGSPRVAPSLLACPGLPPPAMFAAMRDGGFATHGWTEPRS